MSFLDGLINPGGKKESLVGVALPPSDVSMCTLGGNAGFEGVRRVVREDAVEERVTDGVGETLIIDITTSIVCVQRDSKIFPHKG